MADPKKNPLIGAFRAPVPGAPPDTPAPPEAGKPPAAGAAKPIDEKKGQEAPKAPAGTTPKPTDGKKGPEAPKAPADTSAKPADGKKGQEAPKAPADTPAKPTNEKKGQEEPKAPTDTSAKPADGKKSPVSDPSKPKDEKEQEPRSPDLRFVALSKIKPLPGTYVKDEPRKDYSGLIADIKKNGLQKPVILRKSEKEDEFQLVDGFHRCKALEQAGMLEVRADVYEMSLAQASEYRKGHRDKPLMPVPGKLVPYPPEEPAKADKAPEAPAVGDEELPENLKIPLTKEGQPETVTTMKVANIRPFEGHPFAVRDNKDMWDLVDSIKKFGVLEPVMVIPHKDGGYEMVSGHRRMRACQLAGIENIPVIVRNLDRDEAIISMVDSNLKREEISPTRNEWQRHKDGSWEISNLVYKMTFNIVKSGDEWKLTWELSYTAPGLSQGYWGYTRSPRERIEYEGSKKYKTMEGAQKYIQSKFDQYAPCFESLSPPIPAEAKELFCVNGQLLQGYSLQPPVPQKEKVTLEDLLNCLEDDDMAIPSEAQPISGEPAPPAEEKPQAGPPLPVQVQAQTADRGKQEPPPAKAARPAARKKPLHKKRLAMAR